MTKEVGVRERDACQMVRLCNGDRSCVSIVAYSKVREYVCSYIKR